MTLNQTARALGTILSLAIIILGFFAADRDFASAEIRSIRTGTTLEVRTPQSFDRNIDEGFAGRIVCRVYSDLNEVGAPIPHLEGPDCPPSPPPPPAECEDGIDNDGDSFIDRRDPNCHTDSDPTNDRSYDPKRNESGPLPACANGIDDDGDGKIDMADPGCSSPTDNDETDPSTPPQCSDGIDNDGDGKIDMADPGCSGPGDNDETDGGGGGTIPQCSDNVDNDNDSLIDEDDPGCHTDFDASNPASYDPDGDDESRTAPQCSDGVDNDGDGKIDMADPGCSSASDNDETDPTNGGGPGPTPPSPSSGGSSGGGNGPIVGSFGVVLGTSTGPSQAVCDQYLTAFIRQGQYNNPDQVRRLQIVLTQFEGAPIQVNGVYDNATLAAVHAFQKKYASEMLTPWKISDSTGFVYLTTRKKVNEIFCRNARQFPLTARELKIIEDSIAATGRGASAQTSISGAPPRPPSPPSDSTTTGTLPRPPSFADILGGTATSQPAASLPGAEGTMESFWERVADFFRGAENGGSH